MSKIDMPEASITITRGEYQSLRDDSRMLRCLEGAGVDNWEGFHAAMQDYHAGEDDDEQEEDIF